MRYNSEEHVAELDVTIVFLKLGQSTRDLTVRVPGLVKIFQDGKGTRGLDPGKGAYVIDILKLLGEQFGLKVLKWLKLDFRVVFPAYRGGEKEGQSFTPLDIEVEKLTIHSHAPFLFALFMIWKTRKFAKA